MRKRKKPEDFVRHIFAERVNRLMDAFGDRATDLAKYLHVTQAAVSRYRRGRIPDIAVLGRIAQRYGVSIEYLVGHTSEVPPSAPLEAIVAQAGFALDEVLTILRVLAARDRRLNAANS